MCVRITYRPIKVWHSVHLVDDKKVKGFLLCQAVELSNCGISLEIVQHGIARLRAQLLSWWVHRAEQKRLCITYNSRSKGPTVTMTTSKMSTVIIFGINISVLYLQVMISSIHCWSAAWYSSAFYHNFDHSVLNIEKKKKFNAMLKRTSGEKCNLLNFNNFRSRMFSMLKV